MNKKMRGFGSFATIFATIMIVLGLLISPTTSFVTAQNDMTESSIEETRSDDYLTAAIQSQIENLNPLTIQDVWSAYAARDPIYGGLSGYHQETQKIVPTMAYDWSPIGPSGEGTYDPSKNYVNGSYDPSAVYEDPDPDTIANEALPSEDQEVVVRMRSDITFHRSEDWYGEGEEWESPKSDFTMPGEKMEEATAQDVVFSGEMLQWKAPLFQSGFLPLEGEPKGDDTDGQDENWVINGGTGMYPGMQLFEESGGGTYDYSIDFKLEEPYSMFYVMSFPMVMSMKVWDEHTLTDKGPDSALNWGCGQGEGIKEQRKSIVGTGKFMWTEWDVGSYIKLDTNPDYWLDGTMDKDRPKGLSLNGVNEVPSFKGIEFIVRRTTDAAVISLKNGEVDSFAWPVDPGYITELQKHPEVDVMSTPEFGFFYMAFNMRRPAFGYTNYPGAGEKLGEWYPSEDPDAMDTGHKFRQAVTYATDKSYIVNNLLQGYGSVGWSVVSPDNGMYHNRTVETYQFDLAKAADLLDQQNEIWRNEFDGFSTDWDPPGQGGDPDVYPIPRKTAGGGIEEDTSKFYLKTPTAQYDPIRAKAGIRIATTLREELGVQIEARPINFQSLVGKLDPGVAEFDMYILGWSIGGFESLGSLESFFHSRNDKGGGYNMPGLRNKTLDNVVERAEKEMDPDRKIHDVKQLQGILSKALPYNVLFYRDQINGYRKEWKGWVDWPGGIWNGFSFGNLHKKKDSGGITISAPSDIGKETQHDIRITVLDENGEPKEGVEAELSVTHEAEGAVFMPKTSNKTDVNGVVNATFTAPDVNEPTVVTLTVEVEGREKNVGINVYPEEPPKLYLDVNADIELIKWNEKSNIELSLEAEDEVENVTVSATITPAEAGDAQLSEKNVTLAKGEKTTISFQAPNVEDGNIREYRIDFQASQVGWSSSRDSVEIQVEGKEKTTTPPGPLDAPGVIPLLIGAGMVASIYEVYRRKYKKR